MASPAKQRELNPRREAFKQLHRDCMIESILNRSTQPESEMNITKLRSMTTADIIALYNDLTNQDIKRMATRAAAEKRAIEALKAAGKWEEVAKIEGISEEEAKNQRETAKAGINDGAVAKRASATRKSAGKPAAAAKPAKTGNGSAKKAKTAPRASSGRGAPRKDYTYTAIGERAKGYNPNGLKIQANSARAQVLAFIQSADGGKTRKQIEAKFEGAINHASACQFLTHYGFAKASEA